MLKNLKLHINDKTIPFWAQSPDYITSTIERYGCWEPNVTYAFTSLLSRQTLSFCDVGAHFGYYSVLHKYFQPDSSRLAVEPNPTLIFKTGALAQNLATQEILGAAIGDGLPMDYGISKNGNSGGSGKFVLTASSEIETIPLSSLPSFSLYKIDVEGGEYEVLNSLCERRTLPLTALYIFLEVSPALNYNGALEATKLLLDNGYYVYDLGLEERGAYGIREPKPLDWGVFKKCRQTNLLGARNALFS